MPNKQSDHPTSMKKQEQVLMKELTSAIGALLTIEGVEGIGQPITVINPGDLRPDLLGVIERLRGGPIRLNEEMLLITFAVSQAQRRKRNLALDRLSRSLLLLCRYAMKQGVSTEDVLSCLSRNWKSAPFGLV
jgi:uncharacterized protein (UPF0371 family)